MKRFINTKTIFLGLAMSGAVLLTGCLKDTGPVQDFSQSPPVISFQGDGQGDNSSSVAVLGTSSSSSPVVDSFELSLGTANLYLSTPVKVTVAALQATLDSFNNVNGSSYVLLPSAAYSIQGGGAITIPAGKNLVNFAVSFFGSAIDFNQQYALPLTITAASGANSVVASNLNTYIAIITPANIYSGSYTASGARILYNGATVGSGVAATSAIGGTVAMTYVSPTTSTVQLGDLTTDFMDLTVNPDNSVTVGPASSGATFANLANDGTCTYNPGTKTFTLAFKYYNGSGNLRHIDETLTAQ